MRKYVESGGWDAAAIFVVHEFNRHGLNHFLDSVLGCRAHRFPFEGGVVLLKGIDEAGLGLFLVPDFYNCFFRATLVGGGEASNT